MANRNVMPTLPPRNTQPQQQRPQNPQKPGPVNKKALIIFAIIVIGIIVLIAVKSCAPSEGTVEPPVDSSSEPLYSYEPEPTPPGPEENSGTSIPKDSLPAIFDNGDSFVLATDVAYTQATSVADVTAIDIDTSLSIRPVSSCIYTFLSNGVVITHNSGSIISISRAKYSSSQSYSSEASITACNELLAKHAVSNGLTGVTYGDVFLGTAWKGRYVKGTVTIVSNTEDMSNLESSGNEASPIEIAPVTTTKTFILCYIFGDPEVYTVTALYDSQDAYEVLFSNILWKKSQVQLN